MAALMRRHQRGGVGRRRGSRGTTPIREDTNFVNGSGSFSNLSEDVINDNAISDSDSQSESLSRASSASDLGYTSASVFGDRTRQSTPADVNANVPTASCDSTDYEDEETAELARLRCRSICTEAVAERHKRKHNRSADYPGLAFGTSVFSSNTMMKFSIIKNELHNVLHVQLRRVRATITLYHQQPIWFPNIAVLLSLGGYSS